MPRRIVRSEKYLKQSEAFRRTILRMDEIFQAIDWAASNNAEEIPLVPNSKTLRILILDDPDQHMEGLPRFRVALKILDENTVELCSIGTIPRDEDFWSAPR